MLIFVYGTLEGNSIMNGKRVGNACTKEEYYMGENNFFPYLIHEENYEISYFKKSKIQGTVYEIKPSDIDAIDEYEGHPTFFKREAIQVYLEGKEVTVQCYFFLDDTDKGKQ